MTADLTKLEALETLAEKATPGKWEFEVSPDPSSGLIFADRLVIHVDHREDFGSAAPDCQFIASSRTAVPVLAKFLRGELERHNDDGYGIRQGKPHSYCTRCGEDSPCPTRIAAEKALEALP